MYTCRGFSTSKELFLCKSNAFKTLVNGTIVVTESRSSQGLKYRILDYVTVVPYLSCYLIDFPDLVNWLISS